MLAVVGCACLFAQTCTLHFSAKHHSEMVTGLPELKWRRKLSRPPSASVTWLSGPRISSAHPIGRMTHPLLASVSDPALLSGWAGLAGNQEHGRRGTGVLESNGGPVVARVAFTEGRSQPHKDLAGGRGYPLCSLSQTQRASRRSSYPVTQV